MSRRRSPPFTTESTAANMLSSQAYRREDGHDDDPYGLNRPHDPYGFESPDDPYGVEGAEGGLLPLLQPKSEVDIPERGSIFTANATFVEEIRTVVTGIPMPFRWAIVEEASSSVERFKSDTQLAEDFTGYIVHVLGEDTIKPYPFKNVNSVYSPEYELSDEQINAFANRAWNIFTKINKEILAEKTTREIFTKISKVAEEHQKEIKDRKKIFHVVDKAVANYQDKIREQFSDER